MDKMQIIKGDLIEIDANMSDPPHRMVIQVLEIRFDAFGNDKIYGNGKDVFTGSRIGFYGSQRIRKCGHLPIEPEKKGYDTSRYLKPNGSVVIPIRVIEYNDFAEQCARQDMYI